jgi:hypothetical protein
VLCKSAASVYRLLHSALKALVSKKVHYVGDASSQRPPLHLGYPMTRHALRDRMQSQSDFEEHPENEDIDIDEMIRNYRAKKKRPAKSTK